jgi:hypothetical protein
MLPHLMLTICLFSSVLLFLIPETRNLTPETLLGSRRIQPHEGTAVFLTQSTH